MNYESSAFRTLSRSSSAGHSPRLPEVATRSLKLLRFCSPLHKGPGLSPLHRETMSIRVSPRDAMRLEASCYRETVFDSSFHLKRMRFAAAPAAPWSSTGAPRWPRMAVPSTRGAGVFRTRGPDERCRKASKVVLLASACRVDVLTEKGLVFSVVFSSMQFCLFSSASKLIQFSARKQRAWTISSGLSTSRVQRQSFGDVSSAR